MTWSIEETAARVLHDAIQAGRLAPKPDAAVLARIAAVIVSARTTNPVGKKRAGARSLAPAREVSRVDGRTRSPS